LPTNEKSTYGQILKSSAIIGGASVLNIGFGIVRTKVMAVLLGPAGLGVMGLYISISDLTRSIAVMGMNDSGVRQIAAAISTGDTLRIARMVTVLRRMAFLLGALGALALVVFSKPISRMTFGNAEHAGAVALLSLCVLFATISAGQGALVQGARRVGDLARMSVLGAFYGTVFSIPIIYFMGQRGLAPFLVCVAGMGIVTSWWYARKIKVEPVQIGMREIAVEASELLKLGFVFMASGFMTVGAAYLIRMILLRKIGVEAAGFYQSAWVMGGIYVGFILQAMGADFYPRLTAAANDNAECNRLANEQAEVGLLLAGPGLLATLSFAPLVIQFFYSAKFGPAADILRWICLGMMTRVVTWPMGFIVVAKGARKLFFLTELLANGAHASLAVVFISLFGFVGAGMAFLGMCIFHSVAVSLVVRRLSGFRWSVANQRIGFVLGGLIAATFLAEYCLPQIGVALLGMVATVLVGFWSVKTLCSLALAERFPPFAQKLLVLCRLIPAKADV
jgi:PST family polysaccharide transporter